MSLINILIKLNLLSWSTIFLGLQQGWTKREDAIQYAVDLTVKGYNSKELLLIATGECLEDSELMSLISTQINQFDHTTTMDKWRLAHLIKVAESNIDKETKLELLQEVYANFGYPEDMVSCSIYSQDKIAPLQAMDQVIRELKIKLL